MSAAKSARERLVGTFRRFRNWVVGTARMRRLRYVEYLVARFPNTPFWSRRKFNALRGLGADLQWPVWIDRNVWIAAPHKLKAGPGLVLARGVVLTCAGGVEFGSGCLVGYYGFVCSANHAIPESRLQPIQGMGHDLAPVKIGDNCWIGAHGIVLPGVTLGDGSVVGAGTVVARDATAGAVVVGASPRLIRVRPSDPGADE